MVYMIYFLAKYPKIQQKLFEHVKEVCGFQTPSFNDVPKLTYVR